jgi:hypothetical protein
MRRNALGKLLLHVVPTRHDLQYAVNNLCHPCVQVRAVGDNMVTGCLTVFLPEYHVDEVLTMHAKPRICIALIHPILIFHPILTTLLSQCLDVPEPCRKLLASNTLLCSLINAFVLQRHINTCCCAVKL